MLSPVRYAYNHGAREALSAYGLEKIALGFGSRVKGWMGFEPHMSWGDVGKRVAIGDPKKAWGDFQHGRLFKPGGALHSQIFPKDLAGKVMTYGMPAIGLLTTLAAPPHQRGEAVGQFLGGTLGGTLGLPLGMAGSMAGSMMMAPLGGSIGKLFDRNKPPPDPQRDEFVQNGVSY
jgi:hypothetical protein